MKNFSEKIKALTWGTILGLISLPAFVSAQQSGGNVDRTFGIPNPLGDNTTSIPAFIEKVLEVVLRVGVMIAVLAFVYVGFLFVKAQGNEEELKTAKSAFTWTVIGTAVLLGAYVLAAIIKGTINQLGA